MSMKLQITFLLLPFAVPAFAQTSTGTENTKDEPKTVRELLDDSLNWYQIYFDAKSVEPMHAKAVLRWTNPARNNVADGFSAVYEHEGRPLAMVGVFPSGGDRVTHEFHLLARKHGVVGRENANIFWNPKESEVLKFVAVPDCKAPSKSERLRSLQLKELSRRFEVEMMGWNRTNSDRQMLRHLTTPVFEYGKADTNTLDGAVFAFCVNGTDPEAFLQIEAYRSKKDRPFEWQYAFSKATGAKLVARLDKKTVVWETVKFAPMYDPAFAFRAIYRAVDHGDLPNK